MLSVRSTNLSGSFESVRKLLSTEFKMPNKLFLVDHILSNDKWLRRRIKARKIIAIIFMLSMGSIYCVSTLLKDDQVQNWPLISYYAHLRGMVRRMTDAIMCLFCYFQVLVLYFYNFYVEKHSSILGFFRMLKGELLGKSGMDSMELKKLQKHCRKILELSKIVSYAGCFTVTFAGACSLTILPQPNTSASFLCLVFVLFAACIYEMWTTIVYPLAHLYLTFQFFKIRINKLEAIIQISGKSLLRKIFRTILPCHDHICKTIVEFSNFWKIYYFLALVTLIPATLFCLHNALFGDVIWFQTAAFVAAFFGGAGYIFILGLMFSQLSYEIHNTRKCLYYFIFNNNRKIPLRVWLKGINTLERMSSKSRKIGFTCLTIFTVNYRTFLKVSCINE